MPIFISLTLKDFSNLIYGKHFLDVYSKADINGYYYY